MAFPAKDGKKFSMASRRNAHDKSNEVRESRQSAMGAPSQSNALTPPDDPSEDPQSADPSQDQAAPEQVAEEHGPATQITTSHDDATGMHTVDSVHPDGHMDHSEHASADEAHEHAKKLAGGKKKHETSDDSDFDGSDDDNEY